MPLRPIRWTSSRQKYVLVVELLTLQAVRQGLSDAERVLSGNGSDEEKAAAEIEVEVFTALQSALSQQ